MKLFDQLNFRERPAPSVDAPAPETPAPAPSRKKPRGRNNVAANKARQRHAEKRYREVMKGGPLTTPQIAAKLGCASSANILKTLESYVARGLVKCLGRVKRTSNYGKPPWLWQWCGD